MSGEPRQPHRGSRHHEQPEQHHRAAPDPVGQPAAERHDEGRAQSLGGGQEAGGERRLAAVHLQVERDQDQRAEQRCADQQHRDGRGGEPGGPEQAQIEKRAADSCPQRMADERQHQHQPGGDRNPRSGVFDSSVAGRL